MEATGSEMSRFCLALVVLPLWSASYSAPAGIRPALRRPGAASILPGGKVIAPIGRQYITGPGPFGLAVSPNGRTVVSADGGPDLFSLSVLEGDKKNHWQMRRLEALRRRPEDSEKGREDEQEWRSVFLGLAFSGDRAVYASEGNSGRVRLVDLATGAAKKVFDLNQGEFRDSYSGDLALDAARGRLYVLDQANFRMVTLDVRTNRIVSSVRLGRLPFSLALSPDKSKAYVTNIGMFEYQAVPQADRTRSRETGLPFPAFGFPSAESLRGAARETLSGTVQVPGLGDPNVRESNSVCVLNLEGPEAPKIQAFIRAGEPFGPKAEGGSSPSGVTASADRVFVSNGHNDSIIVIDAHTNEITSTIPIRVPGLEDFRGVLPIGLAWHAESGWLLVAEAGINAVGIIDVRQGRVIGHLPAGWFPAHIVVDRENVYVANVKGFGVGPNLVSRGFPEEESFLGSLRRGTISVFPLPAAGDLARTTATVLEANGFRARPEAPVPLPSEIRYVVLIVKENRTFDEVLGDIERVSNGPVMSLPVAARFGRNGWVGGGRKRLSLQRINVTPNHHAIALEWCFSDNFYADSEVSVDGHHWLVGAYPNAWTESSLRAAYGGQKDFRFPTTAPGRLQFAESNSSVHPEEQPEAGTIWHHLARHGISFRNYGEGFELAGVEEGPGLGPTGARFLTNVPMPEPLFQNTSRQYPVFNMNIPDQVRATRFIEEVEQKYVKGGEPFPRFLFLHLPNDHMAAARPQDGFPYTASFVADNDYALGRIMEFLSRTRWWRQMAVFITEDDAQGGRDHIDAHRTVFIGAGPYFKRNYVSHVNTGFPGMLKTILRLLGLPPLNLFDAAASDLSDCFTNTPDFGAFTLQPVDARLFVPDRAREAQGPEPSPRLDDPRVVREQHRQP
jgi:YVTN family beta-propeller protein